jgi:hypothetical protein
VIWPNPPYRAKYSVIWARQIASRRAGCVVRGDYQLALKANRPVLHQDVIDFFDDPPAGMIDPPHQTTDADRPNESQAGP